MLQLSDLIKNNPVFPSPPAASDAQDIQGLASDSRKTGAGFLFAALPGEVTHGENFIPQALSRGVRTILGTTGLRQRCAIPDGITILETGHPHQALAHMAARWWQPQPGTVAAVTGTEGKSSSVEYLRQLWTYAGLNAASIGTLGIHGGTLGIHGATLGTHGATLGTHGATLGTHGASGQAGDRTTPDCISLHQALQHLTQQSIDHVAIEASSHGLAQHRVDGVVFTAAAFTRLGRDHMDYHQDVESYFQAKARLFGEVLPPSSTVILSRVQKDVFERLKNLCRLRGHRIISYGEGGEGVGAASVDADIAYRRIAQDGKSMDVSLAVDGTTHRLSLPFVADFQILNALCALGMFVACGGEWQVGVTNLARLTSPSGRLEKIGGHSIYIDYAHTPDALSHVLTALAANRSRNHQSPESRNQESRNQESRNRESRNRGKLILVLGCGGDRDQGKRSQMGEVAARIADRVIVTDDNPRHEDPIRIRRMIIEGIKRVKRDVEIEEIAPRSQAIRAAVASMADNDTLLIAGKGHERVQIVGDERLPLDERAEVLAALGQLGESKARESKAGKSKAKESKAGGSEG